MKLRRHHTRLVIRPVAASYRPAYPRSITDSEFRELIEPRLRFRLERSAAPAMAVLLTAACARDVVMIAPAVVGPERPAAPDDLEARVLTLIRELRSEEHWAAWFRDTTFARRSVARPDETRDPTVVPHVPISFGNSYTGVFDVERARRLAMDVFRAYGLEPSENHAIDIEGARATVDGYDDRFGLGFELRGPAPGSTADPMSRGSRRPAESADEYLDDEEKARVRAAGFQVHVQDPLGRFDGDDFTPTLTYLAALVDFLNAYTDGPDLDLSAILWAEKQRLYLPQSWRDTSGTFDVNEHRHVVTRSFDAPTTVTLEFNGDGAGAVTRWESGVVRRAPLVWTRIAGPLATRGVPTVISFNVTRTGGSVASEPLRRLVQENDRGASIRLETRAAEIFPPSTFDAAAPFSIEVDVEAGTFEFESFLMIGAPSR